MLLDINRKLLARSDRVKSVDFHPTEPHVICGLYNGQVKIWNYETQTDLKTFEVTDVPVRCVRYIARKNWFVSGSDDFQLRVYNISTGEKITSFEAHPDYIRCLTVHPTLSLVLTGSDDMTVKCWDWDKGWRCVQIFEGHTHYIMALAINPKDPQTFASACLDHTVKVWSLGNPVPNFSLEAHEKGVNYVDYYHGGDKPYLVTTGDDRLVKIWDYHSKSCVQTLESHTANVSFAIFHPSLPIILSGSEDGTIKIWHSSTYRLENTLSYGLERAWCVAYRKSGNEVAVGFDEGAVVVKLGRDEPSVSMDSAGKIVYARNTEILTANVSNVGADAVEDGQRLMVSLRDLGTTEVYPQSLQHSPNGRFVTVCGDGEYIIYTSLAWRNKAFGSGLSFAWATDSNTYAVQEGKSKIRIYRNFKERPGLIKSSGSWAVEGIHGGTLLAARGNGFVMFWDWETGSVVRRIEVDATNVSWSATGNLVAITAEDSFYILSFDRDAYNAKVDSGEVIGDEGVEEAFDVIAEISESVKTAKWIGDCFIYTNSTNRLSYLVGDQPHVINHFDQGIYLLGYLPAHNRIYVADKDLNIYSYSLSLTVVEYQTAILRGDLEGAEAILPTVPADQRNRIARFLEGQDLKELALSVSTDPDHRFDLAISLNDLETALSLVRSSPEAGSQSKWKVVGDKALAAWQMDLAQEAFEKAGDLSALLLLFTSLSDRKGLERLGSLAKEKGQNNIAFASYLQLGDSKSCIEILSNTNRLPEAALFARSYAPQEIGGVTAKWKKSLEAEGRGKISQTIADPAEDRELFGAIGSEGVDSNEEGSGVLVEKDDGDVSQGQGQGVGEKAQEVVEIAKEGAEELVEKVKELSVGGGEKENGGSEATEDKAPVTLEPPVEAETTQGTGNDKKSKKNKKK
uniref:Coatomer subunit beta' n=1 Tax=Kwoniella bestiolae CBS 10118 TaxID=1296100 RepID=A0A1B9FRX0_9TREE|nr:coatomer beta' subunit [Kwoniella bestiolae CBS 10118]OCF21519.1 coatomer beta' subunit [Kwoniella bestiolae CBS 10118]